MSDTLRPWLAEAVSQYRLSHGRNLTFAKKGRLLQLVQYNNYRNTSLQEEKRKDVYAWAHDKAYEVLIRFDSQAVNAFEETHESFTSYRYGLFHILEYKFILGTDYISEEPRSNGPIRTIQDLANPRMFYLLVTKFNYISSKGEGHFGTRTRKFEELTRNWKTDIEVDEEKKKGLVLQTTASQTHAHDAPPSLEEMQAAADMIRAKRNSSGRSSGRSPKRQRVSRSLNLNNMPTIPPELLATMKSPPVQESDLAEREKSRVESNLVAKKQSPVQTDEVEDLLKILPSTPAPPSSSDSGNTALNNTFATTTTIRLERELITAREVSPSPIQNVPAETSEPQADVVSTAAMALQQEPTLDVSVDIAAEPVLPPPATIGDGAIENRSPPTNLDTDNREPSLGAVEQEDGLAESVVTTSTPYRKKRKSEPLPRFPLDSQDSSMDDPTPSLENGINGSARQSTPKVNDIRTDMQPLASSLSPQQKRTQAGSTNSLLVDVEFLGDAQSSPPATNGNPSNHKVESITALETKSFYGSFKPLFDPPSSPLHDTAFEVTVTAESILGPDDHKANHSEARPLFRIDQDGESVSSAASSSGLSSDGFEFVSFINGAHEATIPSVKVEEDLLRMQDIIPQSSPQLPDLPFFDPHLLRKESVSKVTSPEIAAPPPGLRLNNITQEDLNDLLEEARKSLSRKRSTTSFDSGLGGVPSRQNARSSSSATPIPLRQEEDMAASLRDFVGRTKMNGPAKDSAQLSSAKMKAAKSVDSKPNGVASSRHSRTSKPSLTQATLSLPRTAQAGPAASHRYSSAPGTQSLHGNEPLRPLSRSIPASRRTSGPSIEQSDARKAVNLIMADIKTMLESKGLSRRQSIDLWYCCSGDLDAACQIAESNLDIVRSIQGEISSDGLIPNGHIATRNTRNVYKRCWTLDDDQAVEDPNPEQFKIARKLQEIEGRRGKGSVWARRRFLAEHPLARKLARKVRYPYDDDDS